MDKQTQILVGLGALAIIGFIVYNNKPKKKGKKRNKKIVAYTGQVVGNRER